MNANEVQTRTGVYHLGADGIIRSTVISGTAETLADAQENIRAAAALARGQRRPVLVDMRGMKSQDREARMYYSGSEATQVARALALLSGSRVNTLIANFFLAVTKLSIPTKLFTDEVEAVTWLKGFLQ